VNLWIKTPDMKTLSHMYRQAWHVGLKTTYYLRSLGASNIEKATIASKKEVRGIAGGDTSAPVVLTANQTDVTAPPMAFTSSTPPTPKADTPAKRVYTAA